MKSGIVLWYNINKLTYSLSHTSVKLFLCQQFSIVLQKITHTQLAAFFLGLPMWAGTRKLTPFWSLLKQQTVSGSGISWAIHKSACHSRQITMPAPHHSLFYRLDAPPAAQPTASKHWRKYVIARFSNRLLKGKVFLYSLPSVGPGADAGVQAFSPQVTWSESCHPRPGSRLPLLSARPTVTSVAFTRWRYL